MKNKLIVIIILWFIIGVLLFFFEKNGKKQYLNEEPNSSLVSQKNNKDKKASNHIQYNERIYEGEVKSTIIKINLRGYNFDLVFNSKFWDEPKSILIYGIDSKKELKELCKYDFKGNFQVDCKKSNVKLYTDLLVKVISKKNKIYLKKIDGFPIELTLKKKLYISEDTTVVYFLAKFLKNLKWFNELVWNGLYLKDWYFMDKINDGKIDFDTENIDKAIYWVYFKFLREYMYRYYAWDIDKLPTKNDFKKMLLEKLPGNYVIITKEEILYSYFNNNKWISKLIKYKINDVYQLRTINVKFKEIYDNDIKIAIDEIKEVNLLWEQSMLFKISFKDVEKDTLLSGVKASFYMSDF